MKGMLLGVLLTLGLAACANNEQRPPKCQGEYTPINSIEHYPDLANNPKYTPKPKAKAQAEVKDLPSATSEAKTHPYQTGGK